MATRDRVLYRSTGIMHHNLADLLAARPPFLLFTAVVVSLVHAPAMQENIKRLRELSVGSAYPTHRSGASCSVTPQVLYVHPAHSSGALCWCAGRWLLKFV